MPAVVLSFVMCVIIAYLSNEVGCNLPSMNDMGIPFRCPNEGEQIETSHIRDSQCYRCVCQNHTVVCTHEKCPSLNTCPLVERNQTSVCCKRCKTCNYLGQTYQNNEQWSSGQDSCRTLTCKGGVITQARMQCVTPCTHPQRLVGFCCPVCPISSDQFISKTVETKTNDPCVQCQCDTRWCHCFRTACPALDCQSDEQFTPAGSCCPECKNARESKTVPDGCVFQNATYLNEQSFRPDPCTLCKCQDNAVICRRFLCPLLNCPKNRLYYEKNLCCPRCRDRDPLPCKYENREYKHGDIWELNSCAKCVCANGETICTTIQCPFSNGCPKGYQYSSLKKDQCCRTCEEIESTCTVFGDPHYQTFDGRMYNFQGTCRYVLAKNCRSKSSTNEFSVIVQNEPRGQEQYTWTRHVSLRLPGGKRVALLPGKLPHIELGLFSVTIHKENVLLRVVDGPKIVWDGNSYVEVTVSSKYRKSMCGLCGNYNGNPDDDFQKPNDYNSIDNEPTNSLTKNNINTFGQSWRVGPWKACKSKKDQIYHKRIDSEKKRHGKFNNNIREQIGPETFRKLLPFPGDNDNNSPIIFHNSIPYSDSDTNKKPKKRLQPSINEFIVRWNGKKRPRNLLFFDPKSFDDGKINPKTKVKRKRRRLERLCPAEKYETRKSALDRCELLKSDLFSTCHAAVNVRHYYRSCIMDACACPPTGRCYCEAMLAYARKCEKENILIDWRTKSNCVSEQESKCPMENGVFSLCTSSCGVKTCENLNDFCLNDSCVPGCQCPNGTVLYSNKCVSVDECPKK